MALSVQRPARRLRAKTPPPLRAQCPLPEALELLPGAAADSKRQAYLVTLPCPKPGAVSDGVPLVKPGSKTQEEVLACLLNSLAHPDYANSWLAHGPVPAKQLGVWREFHLPGPNGEREEPDHGCVLPESSSAMCL